MIIARYLPHIYIFNNNMKPINGKVSNTCAYISLNISLIGHPHMYASDEVESHNNRKNKGESHRCIGSSYSIISGGKHEGVLSIKRHHQPSMIYTFIKSYIYHVETKFLTRNHPKRRVQLIL